MSICRNCNQESLRVKTTWHEHGEPTDSCPNCSPESFDSKVTDPSDKKIWMGFEAHPGEYEKRYDSEGVFYMRKPEYRAEQEERLRQSTEEERTKHQMAVERKRKERRTEPMNAAELAHAMRKAEQIAEALKEASSAGTDTLH